jgi:hypothetical protein
MTHLKTKLAILNLNGLDLVIFSQIETIHFIIFLQR